MGFMPGPAPRAAPPRGTAELGSGAPPAPALAAPPPAPPAAASPAAPCLPGGAPPQPPHVLANVASRDVVVFLDGDYSDRPAEMPRLLAPLRAGVADLVVGSRLAGTRRPGAMPWHAVAGNRLAAAMIRVLCGVALTDLGPFLAARQVLLQYLDLREATYGWPVETIVKAARRGARI